MGRRVESPSSINTYKQCARKYYYQYVLGLELKPNVYFARGHVAHKVLENLFSFYPKSKDELYETALKLLKKYWDEEEFFKDNKENGYFQETSLMIINWLNYFVQKLDKSKMPFDEAFAVLKPKEIEQHYFSDEYKVKGFIDAIEDFNGKIRLMDYKTSQLSSEIPEGYKLQLAVYALLFKENNNKNPDEVGIYFLRGGENVLEVNNEMIEYAKEEVRKVHEKTDSDNIDDYALNISSHCRNCDFYEKCFKPSLGKKLKKSQNLLMFNKLNT